MRTHPIPRQVAIPADTPKHQLRREMRRLLPSLGHGRPSILAKLHDWLAAHPERKTISIFSPLPGEIDLLSLIESHPDRRWIFPRVEGEKLVLHPVTHPSTDLEPGAFNIREPKTTLPVIDVFEIDAFFCPGLAFDHYGNRLGRGRGFYDRLLEHAKSDALKIGICHPEQIVADTFSESHDISMDEVVHG